MASNKGGRAGGTAGLDVKLAISEAASRAKGGKGGGAEPPDSQTDAGTHIVSNWQRP